MSTRAHRMQLRRKLLRLVLPIFLLTLFYQLLLTSAYMEGVRIVEIPFGKNQLDAKQNSLIDRKTKSGIHLLARWERERSFFHLFHVPYIICFYAAKGKWPFVPPFMQKRVDDTARTFFSQNDSVIRTFCRKWIQIKECFRPVQTDPTYDIEVETLQKKRCNCDKLIATESPVVYFDKNYIGNVSSETIYNTIEFLESFLPPPTKKNKRKNRVRGRLDELEIE